jgi:hypothetical protein
MNEEPWHLSKTVPLTMVFAIAMQTIAFIWFISSLNSDVENNTKNLGRLESRTDLLNVEVQNHAVTSARIEENIKAIRAIVEDIARRD